MPPIASILVFFIKFQQFLQGLGQQTGKWLRQWKELRGRTGTATLLAVMTV
jgi:hypothetical protein